MCNLQIVLLLFDFSALSRLITAAIVIWLLLLLPIRPLCLSIVCGAMTFLKVEKIKVNFNSWYRFSSWGEERENNSGSAHDESVAAIDVHIIFACKLSEITQRIRWIHASELVTFKGNANSPNGAIKMGKDYSFSSFAVLHQNLLYRWSIGKEKNPCVTYNHRSVMCWMCVCVCVQANKQTNEQASKTINQQDFHYEDQYFSSDLQRDLMRMQEFHKHAKSLQIQPKCINITPSRKQATLNNAKHG